RFDPEPDERTRSEVAEAIERFARELFESEDEEWVDALIGDERWDDARFRIDARLGPSFAGGWADADERLAGFWEDARTFRVIVFVGYEVMAEVRPWVAVSHWHPGSMTSGSWGDELAVLVPGTLHETHDVDEDGTYHILTPLPGGAEAIARRVHDFLGNLGLLHGAEVWLPQLYALLGEDVAELGEFEIDMLPDTTNSGYELSYLMVALPDAAALELRRLGAPSTKESARLLRSIEEYLEENQLSLAEFPAVWSRLVADLRQRTAPQPR
ncbi:MAG: hypothetical protein ACO3RU_16975, partial [Planctomycetota bacterium]